jgi:hypothetical protein
MPPTRCGVNWSAGPPARIRDAASWRSHGDDPLPSGREALDEPFAAFPSWFMGIECDPCGKDRMVNETHAPWRDRTLSDIFGRMRHDGCGGIAGKAELLTGIEGATSRPVRKIILISRPMLRAVPSRSH